MSLGTPAAPGELPFAVTGLGSGTHQVSAFADTNGDGIYEPILDATGTTLGFTLDVTNPFQASVEGVKLYLGTSQPGLCTIEGTVSFPSPVPNQNLSVAALDPSALQGSVDPQSLLTALQQGWRTTTDSTTTVYHYTIFNLTPGQYLPVPALTGLSGGIELNLIADLSGMSQCPPDGTVTADFDFGDVALTGTVDYTPASSSAYAWGAIVARNFTLGSGGIKGQVVLMPAFLVTTGTTLQGSFGALALLDDQDFDLRAFTNLDTGATATSPLTDALTWALNPMSPLLPQATVTATAPSVTVDLKAP
jgi:hypothetical protein